MAGSMRTLHLSLVAVGLLVAGAASMVAAATPATPAAPDASDASDASDALRCSLVPGRTLALLRVEADTTLPHHSRGPDAMSASGVSPGPYDSLLATTGTPMPGARVRLLRLDSVTRAAFTDAGITAAEPEAYIRAAPYRADCRTIRWTDTVPWVRRGDTGYVRGTLAPREQWIAGVPVLVVPEAWRYPYPRRRGLALRAAPDEALTPAPALYELIAGLESPARDGGDVGDASAVAPETWRRAQALAWARANGAAAELEPARSMVWDAVIVADRREWQRTPSRLRGTYRVTLESDDGRGTWFFRTHDRPGYGWGAGERTRTMADLLASPHAAGYVIAGYAADAADALPAAQPRDPRGVPLVWLGAADRPTVPGNDTLRVLRGSLEFMLAAAPEPLWDVLEATSLAADRPGVEEMARLGFTLERRRLQVRVPLTLRIGEDGAVHADTSVAADGRRIRVTVDRVDTTSMRRPF